MDKLIVEIFVWNDSWKIQSKLTKSSSHDEFVDFFKRVADSTYLTVKQNNGK